MAEKWEKLATGIRCRLHPTRRHGIKPDRYFVLRFTVDGQKRQEALGWASEGWTLVKAQAELSRLKEAARVGIGPVTLAEARQVAETKRQAEAEARAREERDALTFSKVFLDSYFPHTKLGKSRQSCRREEELFRLWVAPVIGDKPMKDVVPFDLERIKKSMLDAGRAPRSVEYALAVVRQVFNFACLHGLCLVENPARHVTKLKKDNRRLRFLTHDEAERLLAALADKSPDVRDMALVSLHCGLRAGEVFALTWQDVDLGRGLMTLRDTKSGRSRAAFMTEAVRAMLSTRGRDGGDTLVFPGRGGKRITYISATFDRVVAALGLNDGVDDTRQRVVFHTLRHTFASWLVEQGVDLYAVQRLMGHESQAMTQRYAHLAPDSLRRAVKTLEAGMAKAKGEKIVRIGG